MGSHAVTVAPLPARDATSHEPPRRPAQTSLNAKLLPLTADAGSKPIRRRRSPRGCAASVA